MFTVMFFKGGLMLNCETVVFRLFNGGDSTVRIMPSRMRNYSVIMISE
jgi:hypothetical protein